MPNLIGFASISNHGVRPASNAIGNIILCLAINVMISPHFSLDCASVVRIPIVAV